MMGEGFQIPKFLYHGTSGKAARKAIKEGLLPRKAHGKSNWKHTIESNPNGIYLTDAYPLYFAFHCEKPNDDVAVIQLETDSLNQLFLVPDEDVLEQAGRGYDDVKGSMKQRTKHYRDNAHFYVGTDAWLASLNGMGTCVSLEPIKPEAITRVAFLNPRESCHINLTASDAMITLANYRFCGEKYRNLTNQLFGLPTVPDPLNDYSGFVPDDTDAEQMLRDMLDSRKEYDRIMAEEFAKARIEEINP